MRHTLVAVLLRDPAQHIGTTIVVEVYVYIGHRDTVGVEETLEEQVVAYRVNIRDIETVGDCRARCRATSRPYEDPHRASGGDEVLHDEEVAREAHIRDRLELEVYALPHGIGQPLLAVLAPSPLVGEVAEIIVSRGELLGDREVGHQRAVVDAVVLDLGTDLLSRSQSLGDIGEELIHLRCGLHPLLLAVAHTGRVVEVLARAQADQSVMRLGILLIEEVNIIGSDDLHPVLAPQL